LRHGIPKEDQLTSRSKRTLLAEKHGKNVSSVIGKKMLFSIAIHPR
jgi:hypothetical protein